MSLTSNPVRPSLRYFMDSPVSTKRTVIPSEAEEPCVSPPAYLLQLFIIFLQHIKRPLLLPLIRNQPLPVVKILHPWQKPPRRTEIHQYQGDIPANDAVFRREAS